MNSWERTGMCLVCPTNQLFIFLGGFIFFLKKCLPTTLNRQRLQRMMQYTVLSMSLNFPLGLLVFRRHDTPPTFCSWHRVGERGRRRHKSRLQHSPSITPLRICHSMQEVGRKATLATTSSFPPPKCCSSRSGRSNSKQGQQP